MAFVCQNASVHAKIGAMESYWFGMSVLVLLVGGYLLPSIVAWSRDHPNGTAIFVLNVLGGWSFVGWLIALVWSLSTFGVAVKRDTA